MSDTSSNKPVAPQKVRSFVWPDEGRLGGCWPLTHTMAMCERRGAGQSTRISSPSSSRKPIDSMIVSRTWITWDFSGSAAVLIVKSYGWCNCTALQNRGAFGGITHAFTASSWTRTSENCCTLPPMNIPSAILYSAIWRAAVREADASVIRFLTKIISNVWHLLQTDSRGCLRLVHSGPVWIYGFQICSYYRIHIV